MALIGLYLVAAALLVVAGVAKVFRPDDTARALGAALPVPGLRAASGPLRWVVRAVAGVEAALGVVALVRPGPIPAALVAFSYLAFAGLLVVVRSRGGALASCGCFGRPDTPVTAAHVVIDVGLGVSAAVVAAGVPAGWLFTVLAAQPGGGVPLLLVSGLVAWLAVLVMDGLARLVAVRRLAGISFDRTSHRASGSGSG